MARVDRVQEELRHQVSLIMQRELNDSRIGLITITRVDASPDLKNAKIYFTAIKNEKSEEETFREDTAKALNSSRGFVRRLLAKRIRMKFIPDISFLYDYSDTKDDNIDKIIEKIHKEKEERYET